MPETRPSLTLAMIVRDEAGVLARCLDSVIGVVDEVVIVDTGSLDKTKELALSYVDRFPGVPLKGGGRGAGLTLLDFEWCDDFSAARNFGLAHIAADWVLHLDADEELRGEWKEPLRKMLADDSVHGYHVTVLMKEEEGGSGSSFQAMRLFRGLERLRFKYPIHEQVVIDPPLRVGWAGDLVIHHFGTGLTAKTASRFERNISILLKAIEEYPEDAYFAATIGNEYFDVQDWQAAYGWYVKAMQKAPVSENWLPRVACNAAMCLHVEGHSQAAIDMLERAAPAYADFTDLPFTAALIHLESGNTEAARQLLELCLKMGDPPAIYPTVGGTGSWRAEELLHRAQVPPRWGR